MILEQYAFDGLFYISFQNFCYTLGYKKGETCIIWILYILVFMLCTICKIVLFKFFDGFYRIVQRLPYGTKKSF